MQVSTTATKRSRPCSVACDACKRRRRKCSGVNPCEYCVGVNKTCTFSAGEKRGPKKAILIPTSTKNVPPPLPFFMPAPSTIPYPLTIPIQTSARIEELSDDITSSSVPRDDEHTPFQVAPYRQQIKDLICVLGLGDIMEEEVKTSFEMHQHVLRAQMYSMLASIARHNDELNKAEILMLEVSKNLKEIFEEPTMDASLAFLCASTYYPSYISKAKLYLSHAWHLAEMAPVVTMKDLRTKVFIFVLYKFCDTTMSITARCTSAIEYLNRSFTSFGDYEVGMLQMVSVVQKLGQKIDITDACGTIQSLSTMQVTPTEKSEFMLDVNILQSFFVKYCLHFSVYLSAWKILILWKSNDTQAATEEAMTFLNGVETNTEYFLMFYCDILPLLLVVMFFKETGNTPQLRKLGHIAKKVVYRTLNNPHFQFYKDLLDTVFPPLLRSDGPEHVVDRIGEESFVEFLFGNYPTYTSV